MWCVGLVIGFLITEHHVICDAFLIASVVSSNVMMELDKLLDALKSCVSIPNNELASDQELSDSFHHVWLYSSVQGSSTQFSKPDQKVRPA